MTGRQKEGATVMVTCTLDAPSARAGHAWHNSTCKYGICVKQSLWLVGACIGHLGRLNCNAGSSLASMHPDFMSLNAFSEMFQQG